MSPPVKAVRDAVQIASKYAREARDYSEAKARGGSAANDEAVQHSGYPVRERWNLHLRDGTLLKVLIPGGIAEPELREYLAGEAWCTPTIRGGP